MSQMSVCIIIFLLTLSGFAVGSSYISITVISLIGMMAMVFTGCLSSSAALGCFSNASAILMSSMFIVAAGLNRTQMVSNISAYISRISKGSFRKVLAGYVILTCILAQFIPSAVVCFSVVFPMALGVCEEMKINPSKMMFSIGITAIGTVVTLPFSSAISEFARINGFLQAYGYTEHNMGVLDISYAKFPTLLTILLLAIFMIPKFAPDINVDRKSVRASDINQQKPLGPVREIIGYATFFMVLLGMIFSSKIGVPTWQIAMAGALVIAATGVLKKNEVINAMNMSMVLLYVGALGIGSALSQTGAAELIGDRISTVILGLNNNYLAGLILFIVPFFLTQFMLNAGIYSIFVPLYIMMCKSMGSSPIGPIMLCMIASMTAFFTPLATPAVPLMMSVGNYSIKYLVKMGMIPAIIITIVSVGWIMTMYPIF